MPHPLNPSSAPSFPPFARKSCAHLADRLYSQPRCQIDRVCQQLSLQGLIDLSRLAMRGERVIAASAYQRDMRLSLVQLCVTLLGTMIPKYGSSVRRECAGVGVDVRIEVGASRQSMDLE